jgi:hypothetical protein
LSRRAGCSMELKAQLAESTKRQDRMARDLARLLDRK